MRVTGQTGAGGSFVQDSVPLPKESREFRQRGARPKGLDWVAIRPEGEPLDAPFPELPPPPKRTGRTGPRPEMRSEEVARRNEAICRDYRDGVSRDALAERHGVSISTVHNVLRVAGFPRKQSPRPVPTEKMCPQCNQVFYRREGEYTSGWMKRIFCSRSHAQIYTRNRPDTMSATQEDA